MKKFVIIICLSLMGISIASQISFNSGMLSEILKFRIDFDKRSMALEDSENMLVQPEGPIFRRTGTEFIDEALTEFSYTVTDTNDSNDPNTPVYGDYTEFLILASNSYTISTRKPIYKVYSDNTANTSWGEDGWFQYIDPNTNGFQSMCYDVLFLDDGRYLIATNTFWIEENSWLDEGKLVSLIMLTSDGSIDTTWGHNGFYPIDWGTVYQYPFVQPFKLFECNDGTFILVSQCNSGSRYALHKISANGVYVNARDWDVSPDILPGSNAAVWGDETHNFIILFGSFGNYPSTSYISNAVAIDVNTLGPYTDWGGLGYDTTAGYAMIGKDVNESGGEDIYDVVDVGDGFVVFHSPAEIGGIYYTLCKIDYGGTAYDTTWGTNGHAAGAYAFDYYTMAWDETYLYVLGRKQNGASYVGTTQILLKYDADGTLVDSNEITVPKNVLPYRTIQILNDYLLLGTTSASPANYHLERWTKDFEYVDGFDLPFTIDYPQVIIPDESTREVTYTGGGDGETTTTTTIFATSDKTRLIPFIHSNTDSYVLEFGHNFVGFLK